MSLQNVAFDVIGMFGFGKDFKATLDLHGEGAQACKCLSTGEGPPQKPSAQLCTLCRED